VRILIDRFLSFYMTEILYNTDMTASMNSYGMGLAQRSRLDKQGDASASTVGAPEDCPEAYPSPVRAVGSNHSTTPCGVADDGTLVVMRHMNRILNIGPDSVTAEAGALYIDVAKELQKHNLQVFVNTEIGGLSIGSGACCGTKDASMAVHHKTYRLNAFDRELPGLEARGDSIMMYINPFINTITVAFRRYRDDQDPRQASSWQWRLRNFAWGTLGPYVSCLATHYIPMKGLRYLVIDRFHQFINFVLVLVMRGKNTLPTDQIIRYPEKSTNSRYIFSIWAFPEQDYLRSLRDHFTFCHDYYRTTGYRWDLPNVGYRIKEDTSSLFSYSFNGPVMTFDPVSTGNPGWEKFLAAYNDFCSQHGGSPLFNQTGWLTRQQIEKAFGERLKTFEGYRQRFDPSDRLLNAYFRMLLA
jgi:hypothetical protein